MTTWKAKYNTKYLENMFLRFSTMYLKRKWRPSWIFVICEKSDEAGAWLHPSL